MGGGGTLEQGPVVAREKEAFSAEILPRCGKTRERSSPVFLFLVDVEFIAEPIGTVGYLGEITLVILPVFFKYDLEKALRNGRRRWVLSNISTAGLGIRSGIFAAGIEEEVPSSYQTR